MNNNHKYKCNKKKQIIKFKENNRQLHNQNLKIKKKLIKLAKIINN